MRNSEFKTLHLKLPGALACRIKGMAAMQGMKISEFITPFLEEFTEPVIEFQKKCRQEFGWMIKRREVEELENLYEAGEPPK